jgi:hypothetical protein
MKLDQSHSASQLKNLIDLNRTTMSYCKYILISHITILFNTMALSHSEVLPFHGLDDGSFNLEIFELNTGPVNFNTSVLASLSYNPLFANANQHLTLANDADPDSHFYCDLNYFCDYFIIEDQFNKLIQNEIHCSSQFSIFHLNIRSLDRNLNKLTNLLHKLNIQFSVIGITETWLQNASHLASGYKWF